MNQISLTEILFEQLLSYFENCKRNGERRMNIVIGIDNGIIEFKRLIPELKISIIDPQLNRLFKLSKLILEEWNKEIYQLDKNGELRCIHIHDDYTVSRKNNVIGFDKWSELYPKARMYSLDVLIDFVNDFNGYCAQKFNLELPPQSKEKKAITLNDFFINLTPTQIENIQKHFSNCKGLEMACFIYQMYADKKLIIIKSSNEKNLSAFLKMFNPELFNKNKIEAVAKNFDRTTPDILNLKSPNNIDRFQIREKIDNILKVEKLEVVVSNNNQL